jgi:hypothetical protein
LVALLASFSASVSAATWYVSPSGNDANDGSSWALAKQTIQAAVNVATGQDIVLVTNGTYAPIVVDTFVIVPSITIRSVNGPAVTKIDGGGSARCVELVTEVTLDGFTLTNGVADIGAGVYMHGGGLVTNCIISGNEATGNGGGVYMTTPDGNANIGRVMNSIIRGNKAMTGSGGGIFLTKGLSSSSVQNSIIRGNTASQGGGVEVMDGCFVRNCLIMGNRAASLYGGGVSVSSGGKVESCTIVGNTANTAGGGALVQNGGTMLNGIIYYNDVEGNPGDMWGPLTNSCYGVGNDISGTGNITNAPLFVDAGVGFGTIHMPGDYRLTAESPAINAGLNQGWMSGATDLAGNPRINGSHVDMGAYEWIGSGKQSQTITFGPIANQNVSDVVRLSATASSGLPVSFSVVSGPATLSRGTNLSFSAGGTVSVKAAQAGNASYDPAPDVVRSFYVAGNFSFRAVALTNNVILRWSSPDTVGFSNQNAMVRYSPSDYPDTPASGSEIYKGTNQTYTHEGRTPGQTCYYTVFLTHDGVNFVNPD